MIRYRVRMTAEAADKVASLHPDLKKAIRAALEEIEARPSTGGRLLGELEGYLKYKVRRYRIVYRIEKASRSVLVVAIGHRRAVYEELADRFRRKEGS